MFDSFSSNRMEKPYLQVKMGEKKSILIGSDVLSFLTLTLHAHKSCLLVMSSNVCCLFKQPNYFSYTIYVFSFHFLSTH